MECECELSIQRLGRLDSNNLPFWLLSVSGTISEETGKLRLETFEMFETSRSVLCHGPKRRPPDYISSESASYWSVHGRGSR